jgi:hypothetical protein
MVIFIAIRNVLGTDFFFLRMSGSSSLSHVSGVSGSGRRGAEEDKMADMQRMLEARIFFFLEKICPMRKLCHTNSDLVLCSLVYSEFFFWEQ